MGFFKKKAMEDATKPLEQPEGEQPKVENPPVEDVAPEDKVEEQVVEDVKVDATENEDRSAYNCGSCNGEGLIWDEASNTHKRCNSCGGTGKVN